MGVPVASWNFRYILVLFQVIDEAINKAILPQERLPPHLCPNCLLPNSPRNEPPVLLLRLSPFPAKLAKYPVNGQTGMGLCFT